MAKPTNKIEPTGNQNRTPSPPVNPIPSAGTNTSGTFYSRAARIRKSATVIIKDGAGNPRINKEAEDALRKQGFPLKIVNAFLETADNLDCIVMSRTPEGPTTTLIDDGYDLKGFEIKSKSCNWGPMAGFLCKLPPLNKVGFDKIKYNYGYLVGFYTKWTSKPKPDKRTYKQLFQPIRITEERKKELFIDKDNIFGLGEIDKDYKVIDENHIYGHCSNFEENSKIEMEYLLIKDPKNDLWQIFHGEISYKKGEQRMVYTGDEEPTFFSKKDSGIVKLISAPNKNSNPVLAITVSEKIRNFKHLGDRPILFYPVEGAINVYPPYSEDAKKHKNCVTGDYDLFACWPKSDYPWKELVRRVERNINNSIAGEGSILTIGLQPYNTFNQLFVEFIPGVPAIDSLEDASLGNINNLTSLAGGTLNSLAAMQYNNPKASPNKAFHSDEGGRPMITDIDFPVSCFLPRSLLLKTTDAHNNFRQGLFNSTSDLIDLISFCNLHDYRITLSHGWFIFLITQALDEAVRTKIVNSITVDNSYLKQIYTDQGILTQKVTAIKKAVTEYFLDTKQGFVNTVYKNKVLTDLLGYYPTNKKWIRKDIRGNRMKAKSAFLEKIAMVFLLFLDMNEPDAQIILNKVKAAKTMTFEKADFEPTNS